MIGQCSRCGGWHTAPDICPNVHGNQDASYPMPMNCPKCGAHDYGLFAAALQDCPHCQRAEIESLTAENAALREERTLIIQRAENAEAALVEEVAKNGRHAMRVTIAQLEARLQKVMARCADLLDEDQFNELDAIASSASGVQYKPCEICTTQSWCETHGCQCYPTEAMCCVDYPRCDCNSPPEPDNAPALQPCGHPWKAQHDSKCILCSSPGVTP